MKKLLISLILILIVVGMALSVLGGRDEYAAEKLFYRAMMTHKKIVINPDVVPPKMVASVEKNLKAILERYPESRTAKAVPIALAEFYVMNKKYDKAIAALDMLIKAKDQDASLLSKAYFFKGAIYERQDQWDKALEEYKILRDEYTDTSLGLQVPLYIGRYYTKKSKEAEADKAYREAAVFYEKLEKDNEGKILGYVASSMLREAYINLGDYEQAGKIVEDTISDYPSQVTFVQQLPYVELIFVNKLKRPEKAIEIYKNVQEKTQDDKIKEILQDKISELEEEK